MINCKRPAVRLTALLLALLLLIPGAGALTLEDARDMLTNFYVDEIPEGVLDQPTIQEMLDALGDPYTVYYTPEEYAAYQASMRDERIVGIGIDAYGHEKGLEVVSTYRNSPAQRAGIVPGDIIVGVDGVSAAGQDADTVSSWLRGEAGTMVSVQILSPDGEVRVLNMTRSEIVIPVASTELVDGKIGYIICDSFGEDTYPHVAEGMQEYHGQADVWMVDLRNNTGGDVMAAAQTMGCILGEVDMGYLRAGSGMYSRMSATVPAQTLYPAIVLSSPWTASASEMFASAIRDYRGGLVVGSRTYGKGVAQAVLDQFTFPGDYYEDGSAMKITAYRYFSAEGNATHQIGVIPHLVVPAEISQDVSYLLTHGGDDRKSDGMLRLYLGGWGWYINIEQALSDPNRAVFAQLLAAISEESRLFIGTGGDQWARITPAQVAAELDLTEYVSRAFDDVKGSPHALAINTLATYQILRGAGDGTFHPNAALTRAELCALLAQAMNCVLTNDAPAFRDVPADAWYAPHVQAAVKLGLVQGDENGNFRPLERVSHEELITVMGRLITRLNMFFYESAKEGPTEEDLARADLAAYSDWSRQWAWLLGASQKNYFGQELNLLYDALDAIDPRGDVLREEAAALLHSILTVIGVLDL